jgi:beta-glucoside operon transcriptional antiterminator
MKAYKSINNNIVSAFDDNGREVVIIGKGVGYKAKECDEISEDKIDKIFVMSSQNNIERLKGLFASIPLEYIKLTDEIITYAKKRLNKRLNESSYFTLADHINFSITRMEQGIEFQSVILSEIRHFYPVEFEIGLHSLKLIKETFGVNMPIDEAAAIALHILNAEYDISVSDAFQATKILDRIVDIVTEKIGFAIDPADYYCERFINHLKFLAQRVARAEPLPDVSDYEFIEQIAARYPAEMHCGETVAAYILEKHKYYLSQEEITSIALHLKRIGMQINNLKVKEGF